MFGELELKTFQTEVVLEDYLTRAELRPRGSILTYLNERQRPFIPFQSGEIYPLAIERQVNCIKQPEVVIHKRHIRFLSLLEEDEANTEQLLATKRPVAFYSGFFVVQGQLHVNADANNQDLLDETRDFFAVSTASIYPIRKVLTSPARHVPLLFINRRKVQAYHVVDK